MVARVWRKHALRPHRLEGYMASNDPGLRDVRRPRSSALYLHPPQHAAVFCVDEKTAHPGPRPARSGVAALAGTRRAAWLRVLPARHAVAVRRVQHQDGRGARQDRGSAHLGGVRRLPRRHRRQPAARQRDPRHRRQPLGAQDRARSRTSSTAHPNVRLHFTPTYSSWLNQVELWFSKIERDVIARGVFTSVADLKRKLMRYIRHYNKAPKTVKWK